MQEYNTHEDERWASRKAELFWSAEFFDLLGAKSISFLEKGFRGVIAQFKEVGYPPTDASLDFLDIHKVVDDIPNEDID